MVQVEVSVIGCWLSMKHEGVHEVVVLERVEVGVGMHCAGRRCCTRRIGIRGDTWSTACSNIDATRKV